MKTLLDITPIEVDEFISHFKFKGLANIKNVNKQNSRVCDAPYDWAKDISYSVRHHFNEWFDIKEDSLSECGISLSNNGVLYRNNECTLTLFKLTKNGNDLILEPFKKYFTISSGLFGIPRFQIPYYDYFISNGYSRISERYIVHPNGLMNKIKEYN